MTSWKWNRKLTNIISGLVNPNRATRWLWVVFNQSRQAFYDMPLSISKCDIQAHVALQIFYRKNLDYCCHVELMLQKAFPIKKNGPFMKRRIESYGGRDHILYLGIHKNQTWGNNNIVWTQFRSLAEIAVILK